VVRPVALADFFINERLERDVDRPSPDARERLLITGHKHEPQDRPKRTMMRGEERVLAEGWSGNQKP